MKRKAFQIIALQSLGPACLFLYTIYLARSHGPSVQGIFAENKSWIELLVAIGCYGFPQSVIIAINRKNASRSILRKQALQYALLWIPIFFIGSHLFASHLNFDTASTIFISIGGAALVVAGIWRGIFLTLDSGTKFHWVTIAPSVFMVAFTALTLVFQSNSEKAFPVAIGIAGVTALLFTGLIFKAPCKGADETIIDYKRLFFDGSDVFLQTATGAAQIYMAYNWLRVNANSTEIGYFNAALMVLQILLFPLASVSPILLNHWSKSSYFTKSRTTPKTIWKILLTASISIGISVAFIPWLVPILFGAKYTPAIGTIQLMLASAVPILAARIVNLQITASGDFKPGTYSAIVKFATFLLGLLILSRGVPDHIGAFHMAALFCTADVFAAFIVIICLVRSTHNNKGAT